MTEQLQKDPPMVTHAIEPLNKRHIIAENWTHPVKTLAAGTLISIIILYMIPVYSITYVMALMPIFVLTAITQLCIGIINEMEEHRNHSRKPMR